MSPRLRSFRVIIALHLAVLVVLTSLPLPGRMPGSTAAASPSMSGLHVSGNKLLNGSNQTVRLLGVNRSGTEYACIQGWGIFSGPTDAASVAAMASWGINTVRLPINEDCWLGINGVNAAYGGTNYQTAIANYIGLLNAAGMAVILDLHWAAPGTTAATDQTPMADRDHAPTFWTQVATAYKTNSMVVFDLFNEPYPDNMNDTTAAWTCWRDGGTCSGVGYTAAGMQELVTAVRNTGATNVIVLGGVTWAAHLSQWLTYKPTDSQNNLMASWHLYNFSQCATSYCWDSEAAPVAAQVPLVGGEIGENDCAHTFIDPLMDWSDAHGAGYLGWTWGAWACNGSTGLISDFDGTPTNYGIGLKNRLLGINGAPSPSPSPSAGPSPSPGTVVDDLVDFSKMAAHSSNLGIDTGNNNLYGGDSKRLVRTAKNAETVTWGLPNMTSFSVTTYASNSDAINYFGFASSPDGVSFTNVGPTITDLGGNWRRIDYAGTVPVGTKYLRVTFPNSSTSVTTPQIGQATFSGNGGFITPTASPSPSATPSPSASPSSVPSPSATPSPTPTPSPSASPSSSPSATPSPSPSPTPHPTPSPTPSPSPSPTPTPTPTPTPLPTPNPTPNPTPSPSPAPQQALKLSINGSGNGSVQPGGGAFAAGTVLALVPHPDAGSLFTGWTVDGQAIGWATPLTITLDHDHTVTATFSLAPSYPDLAPTDPATVAITQLAARGIIKGYADGSFGPQDAILRAQMAALIGRAMNYGDSPTNPFTDRCDPANPANCVDDELWNRVAQLASRSVARGYTDPATCAPAGTPCYAARDFVLHAQVLSFVTRAMVNAGYWQQQPVNPSLYGGVLNGTGHEQDVATYVYYTQALGGVPDYPAGGGFAAWNQAATRGWFSRALWVALSSYFGTASP